jgi:ATP-dependent Clp protease ATP-binding subunit ClpB
VDETLIFSSLDLEEIKQIVDLQLERLAARLAERNLAIVVNDQAKEFIAREGFDPAFGARPLRRAIEKQIQNPLALKVLEGEFSEGDTIEVVVDSKSGGLAFRKAK